MKYKVGDHLQEIGSIYHGIVTDFADKFGLFFISEKNWYLLENDEMELINHWVPESALELHKETLRDLKLEQLLYENSLY